MLNRYPVKEIVSDHFSDNAQIRTVILFRFLKKLDIVKNPTHHAHMSDYGYRVAKRRMARAQQKQPIMLHIIFVVIIVVMIFMDLHRTIKRFCKWLSN